MKHSLMCEVGRDCESSVSQYNDFNKMTSLKFLVLLTCFKGEFAQTTATEKSSSVRRVSPETGETLTLQCFCEDADAKNVHWFRQTLGGKSEPISSVYKYMKTPVSLHGEFKNSRFSLDIQKGNNHLIISDLQLSDSATYHCLSCRFCEIDIVETVHVNVKSKNLIVPNFIHQSVSETIQPGDSVTLNCSVQTGSCDGEHRVYWFKNSEESQPGAIYSSGGRNDQCERKPDSQTHTCTYNLPLKNLHVSHAGTYRCAVVSCGHILFGDEIKLDFKDGVDLLILVYFLSGALIFLTLLVVVLTISLYKLKKRIRLLSEDDQARMSDASALNTEGQREADDLFYAAVRVNNPNKSRRQKNMIGDECVYSSVRQK